MAPFATRGGAGRAGRSNGSRHCSLAAKVVCGPAFGWLRRRRSLPRRSPRAAVCRIAPLRGSFFCGGHDTLAWLWLANVLLLEPLLNDEMF